MKLDDFLDFERLTCLKSGKLRIEEGKIHELPDIMDRLQRLVNKAKPKDIAGQLVFQTASGNYIKVEVGLNAEYISEEEYKML